MADITGSWRARLKGVVPVGRFWQADGVGHRPSDPDVVHITFGEVGEVALTMDREALDSVRAELDAVAAEWDERGRS